MRSIPWLVAGIWLASAAACPAQPVPGPVWPTTTPAAAGWQPEPVEQAHRYGDQIGTAAFMVVQHGAVVVSWGAIDQRLELHSMRKSLLSALIGIAVADGRINLDSTLADLRIDDSAPALTPAEKQATVRDLLGARSGVYHPALYETDGEKRRRPSRGSHPPGTFWYYNNWDFNVLGTIYERAAGQSVFAALQANIAGPIGMQDYRPSDGYYVTNRNETGADRPISDFPAYPLRMTARDLARFGLLYLHHGRWGDRQVVPAAWVAESTRPHSETRGGSGYGYLWWTGRPADGIAPAVGLPPGGYWAEGHLGQYVAIDPADDMVIVHLTHGASVSRRQFGRLVRLVLQAAQARTGG